MIFDKILSMTNAPKFEERRRSYFNMDKKSSEAEYPSVKTDENAEEFFESTFGEFGGIGEATGYYEDHHNDK